MVKNIENMREAHKYGIRDILSQNNEQLGPLLTHAQVNYLASMCEMMVVGEGDVLQTTSQQALGAFIIHSGELTVKLNDGLGTKRNSLLELFRGDAASGVEVNLNYVKRSITRQRLRHGDSFSRGCVLGDFTSLMRNEKSRLDIRCSDSGWVFFISRHDVKQLLHRFPGLLLLFFDSYFFE